MVDDINLKKDKIERRTLGAHLTSKEIFINYIFPEIKNDLNKYLWIDLYAGEGNLILPILEEISLNKREDFFKNHIILSDIQDKMVKKCIENAQSYGISLEIAKENIKKHDNLEDFPKFLKKKELPIFHITNPPYLYLGYIRKHNETQKYLRLFKDENNGYQDLYQIAMINDLRNEIDNLIYIIPANFLFGASVSNKFRLDFLKYYNIQKMIIFEIKIFEFTGTNICIGFFKRKKKPKVESLEFNGLKIKKQKDKVEKKYILKERYKYRAGSEFDEFLKEYKAENHLRVKYYLMKSEVEQNKGNNQISVIDANIYENNGYKNVELQVNDDLKLKINSNILYVRTVDTGSNDGRVGLGVIKDDFQVDGIYVSSNTYRTHPIQLFLEPELSINDQKLLKDFFNFTLEHFRYKLDSEFLTTYKYSNAEYTRKYLGLTQVRALIETFPSDLNKKEKQNLSRLINENKISNIINIFKELKKIACKIQ